jgi:hypothetical protein
VAGPPHPPRVARAGRRRPPSGVAPARWCAGPASAPVMAWQQWPPPAAVGAGAPRHSLVSATPLFRASFPPRFGPCPIPLSLLTLPFRFGDVAPLHDFFPGREVWRGESWSNEQGKVSFTLDLLFFPFFFLPIYMVITIIFFAFCRYGLVGSPGS